MKNEREAQSTMSSSPPSHRRFRARPGAYNKFFLAPNALKTEAKAEEDERSKEVEENDEEEEVALEEEEEETEEEEEEEEEVVFLSSARRDHLGNSDRYRDGNRGLDRDRDRHDGGASGVGANLMLHGTPRGVFEGNGERIDGMQGGIHDSGIGRSLPLSSVIITEGNDEKTLTITDTHIESYYPPNNVYYTQYDTNSTNSHTDANLALAPEDVYRETSKSRKHDPSEDIPLVHFHRSSSILPTSGLSVPYGAPQENITVKQEVKKRERLALPRIAPPFSSSSDAGITQKLPPASASALVNETATSGRLSWAQKRRASEKRNVERNMQLRLERERERAAAVAENGLEELAREADEGEKARNNQERRREQEQQEEEEEEEEVLEASLESLSGQGLFPALLDTSSQSQSHSKTGSCSRSQSQSQSHSQSRSQSQQGPLSHPDSKSDSTSPRPYTYDQPPNTDPPPAPVPPPLSKENCSYSSPLHVNPPSHKEDADAESDESEEVEEVVRVVERPAVWYGSSPASSVRSRSTLGRQALFDFSPAFGAKSTAIKLKSSKRTDEQDPVGIEAMAGTAHDSESRSKSKSKQLRSGSGRRKETKSATKSGTTSTTTTSTLKPTTTSTLISRRNRGFLSGTLGIRSMRRELSDVDLYESSALDEVSERDHAPSLTPNPELDRIQDPDQDPHDHRGRLVKINSPRYRGEEAENQRERESDVWSGILGLEEPKRSSKVEPATTTIDQSRSLSQGSIGMDMDIGIEAKRGGAEADADADADVSMDIVPGSLPDEVSAFINLEHVERTNLVLPVSKSTNRTTTNTITPTKHDIATATAAEGTGDAHAFAPAPFSPSQKSLSKTTQEQAHYTSEATDHTRDNDNDYADLFNVIPELKGLPRIFRKGLFTHLRAEAEADLAVGDREDEGGDEEEDEEEAVEFYDRSKSPSLGSTEITIPDSGMAVKTDFFVSYLRPIQELNGLTSKTTKNTTRKRKRVKDDDVPEDDHHQKDDHIMPKQRNSRQ